MKPEELRVALFSGNYNYVRDGANQALNRLVGFLLRQGAQVRVYSPVVKRPAFPPTGDLVGVPAFKVPGREEYRIPYRLPSSVRRDLAEFDPNIIHIASPDIVAHRAVTWARKRKIPAVASVHTRFETYLQYYHLDWLEPLVRDILRRLYGRCDAIMAPAESTAAILRAQRMNKHISIWSRGVDRTQFNPQRRSLEWRRAHGIGDDEMVVSFLGRLVLEKGLDVFADAIDAARAMDVPLRVVAIGDGPARGYFQERLPDAIFTGQLTGEPLAIAVASTDVFLNPSITETFGNVTLEAMASGLPVMAAAASGTNSLVKDGVTGRLAEPGDVETMASELADYQRDPGLRARHGAAGLEFAKTMEWDEINAAVMHVYERVVERRRRINRLFP